MNLTENLARLYYLKELQKDTEKEINSITKKLKKDAEVNNVQGYEVEDEEYKYIAKIQVRDYSKFNDEKLEDYLKNKGIWKTYIKNKEVLDEEKFAQAVKEGKIDAKELRTKAMNEDIRTFLSLKAIKKKNKK